MEKSSAGGFGLHGRSLVGDGGDLNDPREMVGRLVEDLCIDIYIYLCIYIYTL